MEKWGRNGSGFPECGEKSDLSPLFRRAELEIRDIRFRSVVHSDILSERPATLAIILMTRAIGIDGMSEQAREEAFRIRRWSDRTRKLLGNDLLTKRS